MPFVTPPRQHHDGFFDWAWESVPHHEEVVCGDALFLEHARGDGRLMFLMIDVMDHGPKAAFVVDLFRGFYLWDDATREKGPRELMMALDSLVAPHYAGIMDQHPTPFASARGSDSFVGRHSAALAVLIDPETREVWIAGCGEQAPYVIPDAAASPFKLDLVGGYFGIFLSQGILLDDPFPEQSLILDPGSRLVAFTDGVPDAQPTHSESVILFKSGALQSTLSQLSSARTTSEQVSQLLDAMRDYVGHPWPVDDTTVIFWQAETRPISENNSKN